jgi:hypothetical protein
VSSVIAAPNADVDEAASGRAGIVPPVRRRIAAHPDALVTLALGALLIASAFVGRGGSVLSRTTTVELLLTLLGTAAVAVALLVRPPGQRLWGGVTLLLFAALAVWTALSIAWSVMPSDSWQAANLTFAYLAAFAGTLALAHVAPARWAGVLGAVVLASVVLCGWSLLVKAFPSIGSLDLYARLRAPFDYWNAVGLMAALGIPGCLWLGARRDGHAALSALAVPALGLLLVALLLSYGRGPLLATAVAVACWFAIVPLRLRGLAVLATAGAGTAIVCAWAFANDALAKDDTPLDVRTDAGHSLGLLLLAMVVVLLVAGLALSFAMSRSALTPQRRRAYGTAVLVVLALVPLAGIGALVASDRGLTGSISHGWHQLTDPNAQQPANDPSRLASVGSVRARYWDNGFTIWRKAPALLGVGADGYAIARKPIQPDRLRVRHAHGYVPQTLADLGLVGMGLSAALLIAWFAAAARATGVHLRPRPRQPQTAERIGLMTLATTAIAFGVHSTVDWTWFVPATAVTGLLCAAWVAGRGPLDRSPGPRAALPRGGAAWSAARGRAALAAAVVVTGLVAGWTIWQPQRSVEASNAALTALADNHVQEALADARDAADVNPLSIDPLLTLAAAQRADGQTAAARATFEHIVRLQPANPESWLRYGQFELSEGNGRRALTLLAAALYLDPRGPEAQSAYAQAQQRAAQR